MKKLLTLTALTLALALPLVSAGEVKFHNSNSVAHLTDVNAEVNFNLTQKTSNTKIYGDAVELDDANLSVKNNSQSPITVDLFEWNASAPSGEKIVNFSANTSTSHNVEFGLENLESDTNFTVKKDGSVLSYEMSDANGDISFNNSVWSYHTFTVEKSNTKPSVSLLLSDSSITAGENITITCSANDEDGISSEDLDVVGPENVYNPSCGSEFSNTDNTGTYTVDYSAEDNTGKSNSIQKSFDVTSKTTEKTTKSSTSTAVQNTYSHGWIMADRRKFTASDISQKVEDIEEVSIHTKNKVSKLSLEIKSLRERPSSTKNLSQAYSYFEMNVGDVSDSEISNATVKFKVNSSFADQYDKIILARYESNKWNTLETELVESSEERYTYHAISPGFSYYAVKGQNTEQEENKTETRNETKDNNTENQIESPLTRETNQTSEKTESNNKTTIVQKVIENKVSALVVLVLLMSAVTAYTQRKRLEVEVEKLREKFSELQDQYI